MFKTVKRAVMAVAVVGCIAGAWAQEQEEEYYYTNPIWAKPISNPIYHDTAALKHDFSVVYLWQQLPGSVETAAGKLELDGDLQMVAVQLELPLGESQFALIANRTGYIDFNPESTLEKREGWADIGLGLKWAFYQDEIMSWSLRTSIELPTGDEEVLQSNGEGKINPALVGTYMTENVAINGTLGAILPFDGSENSTMGYLSVGYAHLITDWFSSHVEFNWFHVIESGHGEADFGPQPDALTQIVEFEGGDLVNFGAENADKHQDFASVALGGRFQIAESMSLGVAYEVPLTTEDQGLMDERVTATFSFTF